jgi:hypothetical protein
LAGMLLTILFLPDTTGLDLKEQERRWAYIRAGRESEYHGVAVHPKHLSLWERLRGVGKHYDADLDYKQKIEEMRAEWETHITATGDEHVSKLEREDFDDEADFSHEVNAYFRTTSRSPVLTGKEKTEKEGLAMQDGNGNAHV